MRLLSYYLQIILPLVFLVWLIEIQAIDVFVLSLLAYVLVYRPVIDGFRLVELGLINKTKSWKLFIPFYSMRHFHDLYFKL